MDDILTANIENLDRVRVGPPPVEARIPGHDRCYRFTALVPFYGEAACRAMAVAWTRAFALMPESTSSNYFKKFRRMLTWLPARATQESDTAQTRLYSALCELPGGMPLAEDVEESLQSFASDLFDLKNFSIIKSTNRKSRNKYMEGVKSAITHLVTVQFFPPISFSARLPEYEWGSSTPCLATLARQHGRFPQHHQSLEATAHRYNTENVRLLTALRKCLVDELLEEEKAFLRGQQILADKIVPTVEQIDDALCMNAKSMGRNRWALQTLGRNDPRRSLAVAVKYLAAKRHEGFKGSAPKGSVSRLIMEAGGYRTVSRYIEGTSQALNAAFHIVLIDTGWSRQPCDDLAEDPFVGRNARGKREIRSTASRKQRSGGEPVFGSLKEVEAMLSTKDLHGDLPGVQVIELWQRMSAPLRERARRLGDNVTARRLWIWRSPMRSLPTANLEQLSGEWWPDFLRRHSENPDFGGLPITRQVIRKTVANIRAARNDFDYAASKALADHRAASMPFYYLSDVAVRRLLEDKIREFCDLWEAVGVANIDDAAIKLGVPPVELERREFLGLESGLAFALPRNDGHEVPRVGECHGRPSHSAQLVSKAQRLVPTDDALRHLQLARLAFKAREPELVATNPARWVRTWLPWMAIVEVYCEKLAASRHKVRFEKLAREVERELEVGTATLPLIW